MLGFVNHKALPFELRGKKKLIFGHFENLLQLHKDRFWPKLTECGHDTDLISKLFLEFLSQEKFYIYVVYAMNTVRIQTLCRSHREFFDEIQNESGEKLGVSSFLVQPIQRFLRYRMLLLEIINQLKKQNDQKEITDSIVICINTVCFVERFCDTLNEVQRLADIDQCSYLDEDNFEPKFMIELSDESVSYKLHHRKTDLV